MESGIVFIPTLVRGYGVKESGFVILIFSYTQQYNYYSHSSTRQGILFPILRHLSQHYSIYWILMNTRFEWIKFRKVFMDSVKRPYRVRNLLFFSLFSYLEHLVVSDSRLVLVVLHSRRTRRGLC